MSRLIEQAQLIGLRKSLVGVLTQPAADGGSAAMRPMVVILNSGIIHRVGPNRLGVLLARSLAARGHPVLRFDLSGIGDSEPRPDGLAPLDAALADIREALDWAQAHCSAQRFVLVGLCSGADHAVIYAGGDARVSGFVIMDPTVPRTRKFFVRYFLRRLASADLWQRVFRGHAAPWLRLFTAARRFDVEQRPADGPDLDGPEVRRYLENAYRQALANARECLAVFTDGLPTRHNYPEQLRDALPGVDFGSRFRVEYCHGADHTFTDEALRERVIAMITDWAQGVPVNVPAAAP